MTSGCPSAVAHHNLGGWRGAADDPDPRVGAAVRGRVPPGEPGLPGGGHPQEGGGGDGGQVWGVGGQV